MPRSHNTVSPYSSRTISVCNETLFIGPGWKLVAVSGILLAAGSGLFVWRLFADNVLPRAAIAVPGIALVVIVVISFLLTVLTNPGILPRYSTEEAAAKHSGSHGVTIFRTKDFSLKGGTVTVTTKYCSTCNIYRLPRCSHCSECNNCVERFDHHCPWLGTCVGRRNHRAYMVFVTATSFLCLFNLGVHIATIVLASREAGGNLWHALADHPVSIVLIVYCGVVVWFVGSLALFHTWLICSNTTTHEYYRGRIANGAQNPYNLGFFSNLHEFFWTQSYPWSLHAFGALSTDPPKPIPSVSDAGLFRAESLTGLIPSHLGFAAASLRARSTREDDDISMQLSMRSMGGRTATAANSMSNGHISLPGDVGSESFGAEQPGESADTADTRVLHQNSSRRIANEPHPIRHSAIRHPSSGSLLSAPSSARQLAALDWIGGDAQAGARADSISSQMMASLQPVQPHPGSTAAAATTGGTAAASSSRGPSRSPSRQLSGLGAGDRQSPSRSQTGRLSGNDAGSKAFERTALGVLSGPSRPCSTPEELGAKKTLHVYEYRHMGSGDVHRHTMY